MEIPVRPHPLALVFAALLAGPAPLRPAAAEAPSSSSEEAVALLAEAESAQRSGRYRDAVAALERALAAATARDDAVLLAKANGSLARARLALGDTKQAGGHLSEAIKQAERAGDAPLRASLELERGNLFVAEGRAAEALAAYAGAAARAREAGAKTTAARALANDARTRLDAEQPLAAVRAALRPAFAGMRALDGGAEKADLLVHLGRTALRAAAAPDAGAEDARHAAAILAAARVEAEAAGARVATSYALGYLGELYERHARPEEALALTRRAAFLAQEARAPEAHYRWHWQSGRLLAATGRLEEAIASYRLATAALAEIRHELWRANVYGGDPGEPTSAVYLELADLLLRTAPAASQATLHEARLLEVRETVEQQKAQELRDYFRDECVDAVEARIERIDQVSGSAAVIYPIALADRLELLLTLSSGVFRETVPVEREAYAREVRAFRKLLTKRTTREYLPHARQLFDWVVRPLLARLEESSVSTLVFVPEALLRTVPVAALHDGERHLIDRFSLAITPGLELTDPRPLSREGSAALLGGISEPVAGFARLENVSEELRSISELFPAEVLLDGEFRTEAFEQRLKERDFSLVHLATHAEFGGAAGESFILTRDGRLTLDQLGEYAGYARFRKQPIELLTLSACETAQGDERAALGLAGVAVKAGVRSALGTLWRVNDPASATLITAFYRELRDPSVSKAEALRRAQRSVQSDRRYRHPYYWASFLLISNWL